MTTPSSRLLGAVAIANFLIGLLHVGASFGGKAAAQFFTAGPAVMRVIERGGPMLYVVLVGVLALFTVFGLYAWSAAGFMRRLPLLRTGLVLLTTVYLLRGALLAPQLLFAQRHPGLLPPQAFVFSACALLLGLALLVGMIGRWRQLRPDAPARPLAA